MGAGAGVAFAFAAGFASVVAEAELLLVDADSNEPGNCRLLGALVTAADVAGFGAGTGLVGVRWAAVVCFFAGRESSTGGSALFDEGLDDEDEEELEAEDEGNEGEEVGVELEEVLGLAIGAPKNFRISDILAFSKQRKSKPFQRK